MMRREWSTSASRRSGVALLTVMMTLVLIAAIAAAGRAQTGAGVAAIERDIASTRARWRAEGCAQQAIVILNDGVRARRDTAWNELDAVLAGSRTIMSGANCEAALEPIGRVRDINAVDSVGLERLFRAAGIATPRCDSLTAALLDWADADSVARPAGSERAWYRQHDRPAPRDGRLRSPVELQLIRGFESPAFVRDTIESLLGTDSVRVDLRHASLPVLLSVPELPEPVARELDRTRASRRSDGSSIELSGANGGLGLTASTTPDGWMLIVRARESGPSVLVETRLRLGRASDRIGILAVEEGR